MDGWVVEGERGGGGGVGVLLTGNSGCECIEGKPCRSLVEVRGSRLRDDVDADRDALLAGVTPSARDTWL